jgi:hypothetical protein
VELSPDRTLADLEGVGAACPLSALKGVPAGASRTNNTLGPPWTMVDDSAVNAVNLRTRPAARRAAGLADHVKYTAGLPDRGAVAQHFTSGRADEVDTAGYIAWRNRRTSDADLRGVPKRANAA